MKKFILLVLSISILLNISLVGCTKVSNSERTKNIKQEKVSNSEEPKKINKEKVPNLQPKDYFPLYEGSSWEYQGEGNEYASFTRNVMYVKGNLAQVREDNGGTVGASVFKTSADAITRIFFRGESYDETNYLTSKSNENMIVLKSPIAVGTKWTNPNNEREIVDTKASVTTPAGTFKECIKVKITENDSTTYEYFAKGVGMVMREFIYEELRITSSLKKYDIKTP